MRHEVYWNFHKKLYSVRALSGANKGRVTSHPESIRLNDVTFAVQPAGRAKVLRDRVKNVHAFVRGTESRGTAPPYIPTLVKAAELSSRWTRVTYNPYKAATFVDGDGNPVMRAGVVMCSTNPENGKSIMYAFNVS